jgi:hypothetical protein
MSEYNIQFPDGTSVTVIENTKKIAPGIIDKETIDAVKERVLKEFVGSKVIGSIEEIC